MSFRLPLMLICPLALIGLLASESCAAWKLSTDDTRIVIDVENNAPVVARLGAAGRQQLGRRPDDGSADVEGVDRQPRGRNEVAIQRRRCRRNTHTLTLTFTNEEPKLLLRSIWRARPGHGPVEHWIKIENRSPERVILSHQDSLALHGLKSGGPADVWWIKRGGSNATAEGGTFQQPLDKKLDLNLASHCDDGASPVPWLAVQVGQNRGLYVGWDSQGLGRVHARTAKNTGLLDLDVGNQPEFRTDIGPGEVFLVPPAFVGCYTSDVDEGSYRLHRFVLEKLRPLLPKKYPDPILAYNLYLDAGGPNAKEADVLASHKTCYELGFEAFMPDAMWFPEAGDWRWDPKRFPKGIRARSNSTCIPAVCGWPCGAVGPTAALRPSGHLSVRGPVGHPAWFNIALAPTGSPARSMAARFAWPAPRPDSGPSKRPSGWCVITSSTI